MSRLYIVLKLIASVALVYFGIVVNLVNLVNNYKI